MEINKIKIVLITSSGRTAPNWFGDNLDKFIKNSFSIHEPDTVDVRKLNLFWQRVKLAGFNALVLVKFRLHTI